MFKIEHGAIDRRVLCQSGKWNVIMEERRSAECGIRNTFWLITEGLDMRTGPIKNKYELLRLWQMRDPSFDPSVAGLVLVDENGIVYIDNFPVEGIFLVFTYG
jgi:hypothetical protein